LWTYYRVLLAVFAVFEMGTETRAFAKTQASAENFSCRHRARLLPPQ
jgi:hypothetical protein